MGKKEILTPSPLQKEWADCEIGVLIHYDIPVFQPSFEWHDWNHTPDASLFNPTELDTDQWIRAAKSAGAKYAVLVAKHCTGFCLWPTKAHPYSVASSPWKNGKGDIVGDFVKSCKKYGLRPGLYYSTSANSYLGVDNPGTPVAGKVTQEEYNKIVIQQLNEIWKEYGELFEIWFDGGCLPVEQGGPDVTGLLKKLQPNAIVFQGPIDIPTGIRWVGNESGIAPDDCYATINFKPENFNGTEDVVDGRGGNPFGNTWRPAESDMPNRRRSWFWMENEESKIVPAENLLNNYIVATGRNTNLLLGMVIDKRGLFPEPDAAEFAKFGELVKENFSNPLAKYEGDMSKDSYTVTTDGTPAKYIVIEEDITYGERVLAYNLDNGFTGHCIGHKRIIPLPENTTSVTFTVTEKKDTLHMKSIALY